MSLINFPDVPMSAGVPNVRRSAIGVAVLSGVAAIQKYDVFGILDKFLNPQWVIADSNGKAILTPDSVIAFEYKGEYRIAKYPVEQGSFSSYNKVATPFDARVLMSCGGQGIMSREGFLAQIESLLTGLDLINIITPDFTYKNVNLVNYNYRRESKQGVTLLVVEALFQEVRISQKITYKAVAPSGAKQLKLGNIQFNLPTANDIAKIGIIQ